MSEGLHCFLEGLTPPSMNSLLTIYCIGNRPKIDMKAEVRLFRYQFMQRLPKWTWPERVKLRIHFDFLQPWFYQNGEMKTQDVQNLEKVCIDAIEERYRMKSKRGDKAIWMGSYRKVDSTTVGIRVSIRPLEDSACTGTCPCCCGVLEKEDAHGKEEVV